ncbi:hypothetical protein [Kitasatospora azatica]|uniref:hypothetical protein n=1 Tax=Kitasatospora azatica TaxID=58347 RepID=UPI0006903256|nr:hypothetical protein [Kitasatospora azatica]
MRDIVAGHQAWSKQEFAELALGVDTELFAGPEGPEGAEERAARLDAARDILVVLRREDPELAAYAAGLLPVEPEPLPPAPVRLRHLVLLIGGAPRSGKSVAALAMAGRVAA